MVVASFEAGKVLMTELVSAAGSQLAGGGHTLHFRTTATVHSPRRRPRPIPCSLCEWDRDE